MLDQTFLFSVALLPPSLDWICVLGKAWTRSGADWGKFEMLDHTVVKLGRHVAAYTRFSFISVCICGSTTVPVGGKCAIIKLGI